MPGEKAESWPIGAHTVRVSHLDKLYWPEDGLTKGDLLTYYQYVAPVMLPHLANRPVTLRIFPEGIQGESYYRRAVPMPAPRWLRSTEYAVQSDQRMTRVPLIDDSAGLVWLANKGSIEFHAWSSCLPDLNAPDQAIFDLDPGDEASFADVLQTTLLVREELDHQGLQGWAKSSGRRGMHVHVPLAPGYHFDTVRTWVKSVAERLETTHATLIAVARGATHRGKLVTVDYAQNSIARSMVAAYSVRAVRRGQVAAPVSWDEVAASKIRPDDFTLRTMRHRIEDVGDLMAPALQIEQHLPW